MENNKLTKLTWRELVDIIHNHNESNHIENQFGDKNPLHCYVVFKQCKYWKRQYTLEERTYHFTSDNKFFIPRMLGNSIFADCIGYEDNIRLDYYLGDWEIDYCYIK